MAAPNIVNVATITAKTAVQVVATTATDIVANGATSSTAIKINSLLVSNVATTAVTITASVYRSTTEYKVAHNISVPVGSTLAVIDKTTQIYLEEGDSLRLTGSAATSLHAVASYEILA